MSSKTASLAIYQLKITLIGIEPPIWRRIRLPGSIKLCCLHSTLQVAMGWEDSHLHKFEMDGKNWGFVQRYQYEAFSVANEGGVQIADLLKAEGESMTYHYDFGDDWQHRVELEKVEYAKSTLKHPVCLAGERRCPPEDVGGVRGYQAFLEVILDPKHEDYKEMLHWAGGHFLDKFDSKEVNETLSRMQWPIKHLR